MKRRDLVVAGAVELEGEHHAALDANHSLANQRDEEVGEPRADDANLSK